MSLTDELETSHPQPTLPEEAKHRADQVVASMALPNPGITADNGKWTEYGLTREQAAAKAMNAINAELGTLQASDHAQWNNVINSQMMGGANDPADLWATYQRLVKADIRIAFDGGMNDPNPKATPIAQNSEAKEKTAGRYA